MIKYFCDFCNREVDKLQTISIHGFLNGIPTEDTNKRNLEGHGGSGTYTIDLCEKCLIKFREDYRKFLIEHGLLKREEKF